MKSVLFCGAAAAALLIAVPALALNPQPEPPGKQAHDLSMSVEHTTAATTTAANQACGTGQTAASGAGNTTGAPAGSTARSNTAPANTGLLTNIDKCHTPGDANDNSHTATPPATH